MITTLERPLNTYDMKYDVIDRHTKFKRLE